MQFDPIRLGDSNPQGHILQILNHISVILFAYWIIRKTLNQKVLILNILTGLMWLIHGMCSFACHLVFVWCVYCGIFLDRIDCAECNVWDRKVCTIINDKRASDTIINALLFSLCLVYFVVCMIGLLYYYAMLCTYVQ